MSKFELFKQAIKNPPAHRLAAVEYRSHFLNIIGVLTVCIILLVKGYWYVIFALIFSVGVSYSQGMAALQRYRVLIKFNPPTEVPIEQDISPTRRKQRYIEKVFGKSRYLVLIGFMFILYYLTRGVRWYFTIPITLGIFIIYLLFYYIIFGGLAKWIYLKSKKE
jgi:hypothetical protein